MNDLYEGQGTAPSTGRPADQMPTNAEKKHIYPTEPADGLKELLKTHEAKALAKAWGFHISSIHRWAAIGRVPKHVAVLCDKELKANTNQPIVAMVSIPQQEFDAIKDILEKYGCGIMAAWSKGWELLLD